MTKKKKIIDGFSERLKNPNVKSLTVMILFQLADDNWAEFWADPHAVAVYSKADAKAVNEQFNRLRRALKRQFRASGQIELYDDMMNTIADRADELSTALKAFNIGVETALTQCMNYNEVHSFSIAAATGSLLLLANDAYSANGNIQCGFLIDGASRINDMLSRVELWGGITGKCPDRIGETLIQAVVDVAEKEAGPCRKTVAEPLYKRPGYHTLQGFEESMGEIVKRMMR